MFNPTTIRNKIVPGNIYRTRGSVYGWPEDIIYSSRYTWALTMSWEEFKKYMIYRGMTLEQWQQRFNLYANDYCYVIIRADFDADDCCCEFNVIDEFGYNKNHPDSPWAPITHPA